MRPSWALNFCTVSEGRSPVLRKFTPCFPSGVRVYKCYQSSWGVSVNDSESKIIEDQLFFCFSSFISTMFPKCLWQVTWFVSESCFCYCHHWPGIYSSSGSLFRRLFIRNTFYQESHPRSCLACGLCRSCFKSLTSEGDSAGILHCLSSSSVLCLKFWTDVSLSLCWVFSKASSILLQ